MTGFALPGGTISGGSTNQTPKGGDEMMSGKRIAVLAVSAMALGLWACSSGSDASGEKHMGLNEAFCSDLRMGLTPLQLYSGSKGRFDSVGDFADYAYGAAANECPEQLTSNEGLRSFLLAWNINPDA